MLHTLGGDPDSLLWGRSETTVGYLALTGSIWPEPASLAGPAWSAGYALEHHAVEYFGPMPLPVPRSASTFLGRRVETASVMMSPT